MATTNTASSKAIALETWAKVHYHNVLQRWRFRHPSLTSEKPLQTKNICVQVILVCKFLKNSVRKMPSLLFLFSSLTFELDDFRRLQFQTKNFRPLWDSYITIGFFFHFRQQCAITFFSVETDSSKLSRVFHLC